MVPIGDEALVEARFGLFGDSANLWPHHLGVPSGVSKMISEPMVRLAQTMHLSCTDTNTTSKQKEVRFHMTHVT